MPLVSHMIKSGSERWEMCLLGGQLHIIYFLPVLTLLQEKKITVFHISINSQIIIYISVKLKIENSYPIFSLLAKLTRLYILIKLVHPSIISCLNTLHSSPGCHHLLSFSELNANFCLLKHYECIFKNQVIDFTNPFFMLHAFSLVLCECFHIWGQTDVQNLSESFWCLAFFFKFILLSMIWFWIYLEYIFILFRK